MFDSGLAAILDVLDQANAMADEVPEGLSWHATLVRLQPEIRTGAGHLVTTQPATQAEGADLLVVPARAARWRLPSVLRCHIFQCRSRFRAYLPASPAALSGLNSLRCTVPGGLAVAGVSRVPRFQVAVYPPSTGVAEATDVAAAGSYHLWRNARGITRPRSPNHRGVPVPSLRAHAGSTVRN